VRSTKEANYLRRFAAHFRTERWLCPLFCLCGSAASSSTRDALRVCAKHKGSESPAAVRRSLPDRAVALSSFFVCAGVLLPLPQGTPFGCVRSTKEANYLRRFAAGFHEQKNDIFRNFMIDFDSQLCYNENDKHFLSGFFALPPQRYPKANSPKVILMERRSNDENAHF